MKKSYKIFALALLSFLIVHCTMMINNCEAQWVQMSTGMGVDAIAYNGNNIFAGTWSGVFLSTNNGANWTQAGLNTISIMSIAFSGNNIFAGAEDSPVGSGGVYLSTNNGANWSSNLFTPIQDVWAVMINNNTVFAGADNGVYLSTNNGTNWTQSSLNNDYIYAFAVSGNNIFAGGDNGVYLSTNNGTNWNLTSLQISMASFAVNGNNVFAGTWTWGTAKGVYLSTDNGTSWTQTSLNNRNINSMTVNGNNVFAGTYGNGFYVSTNNGANWTQRNEGLSLPANVFALCILNNYIFAGTGTYGYRRPLSELIIGIQPISMVIPEQYKLHQNYPNPFNPVTKISFDIAKTGFVSIVVYDALGRKVETLVSQQMNAGSYNMDFNGAELTSGVYFYKMEANGFANVKRMVVLK